MGPKRVWNGACRDNFGYFYFYFCLRESDFICHMIIAEFLRPPFKDGLSESRTDQIVESIFDQNIKKKLSHNFFELHLREDLAIRSSFFVGLVFLIQVDHKLSVTKIRTRDSWVRSVTATSLLPQSKEIQLLYIIFSWINRVFYKTGQCWFHIVHYIANYSKGITAQHRGSFCASNPAVPGSILTFDRW